MSTTVVSMNSTVPRVTYTRRVLPLCYCVCCMFFRVPDLVSCTIDNNIIQRVLVKHVTALVPVACSSHYSRSTIYRNNSSFIYDILDVNTNFNKKNIFTFVFCIVRVVKSRRMRWAGHMARMGEDRVVHTVLVGMPEGKRPLGRPRRRWEDNIKINLQKVGGGRGDWMELAQDRDRWRHLWVR
jgi:hypothetical protein